MQSFPEAVLFVFISLVIISYDVKSSSWSLDSEPRVGDEGILDTAHHSELQGCV